MSDFTVNIPEPSQQALYTALGDAIEQLEPAKKNVSNPFFKMEYANLNQLLSMVKPVLSANGLTMTQQPITEVIPGTGNVPPVFMVGCKTVLVHCASGGRLENDLLLPCTKLDPQAGGSAISYSKRYAIKALFLMEDVDDDGNSASQNVQQPQQQPTSVATVKPVDGKQWPIYEMITKDISAADSNEKLDMVYKWGIESNPKLTSEQSKQLIEQCRKRKESISSKQQ